MDDADTRLTKKSWDLGLATKERYDLLTSKQEEINRIIDFTRNYSIKPENINAILEQMGSTPLRHGCKLIDLINRPQITFKDMAEHLPLLKEELESN